MKRFKLTDDEGMIEDQKGEFVYFCDIMLWAVFETDYEGAYLHSLWTNEQRAEEVTRQLNSKWTGRRTFTCEPWAVDVEQQP